MSVSYNTFVGPYIEVYNPEKDSVYEYHSCPNKGCKNHNKELSSKFCPLCGTEIKLTSRPSKERIAFDYYEEFDYKLGDVFSEYTPKGYEDYIFLIGNDAKAPGIRVDGNYVHAKSISSDIPNIEIDGFQVRYKNEITKLREVFGDKNVKVKWGLLVWCS